LIQLDQAAFSAQLRVSCALASLQIIIGRNKSNLPIIFGAYGIVNLALGTFGIPIPKKLQAR
jgi:hypothetical protein